MTYISCYAVILNVCIYTTALALKIRLVVINSNINVLFEINKQ